MRPVERDIPEAKKYVKTFTTKDKSQHERNGDLCESKWARHIGNRTESGVYEMWVHKDDLCKLR